MASERETLGDAHSRAMHTAAHECHSEMLEFAFCSVHGK
jgi:hypothetical protein